MANKTNAVILSQKTYERLKKLLDDYDKGFQDSIQFDAGLKAVERGTGYVKIGIDGVECTPAA